MGKEWLHSVVSRRRRHCDSRMAEEVSSSGCMCAIFQLFDFHPLNHYSPNSDFPEESIPSKGIEAPRNSQEETNLDFPAGIQIRTKPGIPKSSLNDVGSSESPGTKTPTLVARLMGLDLLPECHSAPNSRHRINPCLHQSYSSLCDNGIGSGARSLPETPRVSLARRSDVEQRRLSLQISKENVSPGNSGKHFVKQVIGRRFGHDITNANGSSSGHSRRDETLIPLKPTTKNFSDKSVTFSGIIKSSRFSDKLFMNSDIRRFSDKAITCSGNKSWRFSDKPVTNSNKNSRISCSSDSPLRSRNQTIVPQGTRKGGKCGSSGHNKSPRQSSRNDAMIRMKKEEPSVRSRNNKANPTGKKFEKTPKQVSDALTSKRSVQLSRNPSHPCANGCAAAPRGGAGAEYGNYIRTILERAGLVGNVSRASLSRQIDPSIFYYLEFFFHSGGGRDLSRRCNRKLIFELVDELLGEISRPRFNWASRVSAVAAEDGVPLVEDLCMKIDGFPAANCRGVQDIDSLIDMDMYKSEFEEELEAIVCEIEGGIVESLVRETAAMAVFRPAGGVDRDWHVSREGFRRT